MMKYVALLLTGLTLALADILHSQSTDNWKDLSEVRGYLDSLSAQDEFSGVVLIGKGNREVFHQAYGMAEADLKVEMRTDHIFRIGSLTKPVTASAVLSAVDNGLLSLDDPVCRFLNLCPENWTEVKIKHLLSHTSGIKDHFGDLDAVPVEETVKELKRVLGSLPQNEELIFRPGTIYAYSNFNYILLGAVLEKATNKKWEAAMTEQVFQPLELKTMRYDDVYAIINNRVRGYRLDDDGLQMNIEYDDHAAYAAGGLLSSAGDLFRWSRAMLNGKLYNSGLVEESLTPVQENYGYGWQIREFFERQIYNHTGGIDGFSSHIAIYPEYNLTIIVLSNFENDPAILRACDIAGRLFAWAWENSDSAELTPRQRCGIRE